MIKKYKKLTAIFAILVTMSMTAVPILSFAETIPQGTAKSTNLKENSAYVESEKEAEKPVIPEKDSTNPDKSENSKTEKAETKKDKPETEKSKPEDKINSDIKVKFSASGNGSFIVKKVGEPEEKLRDIEAGKTYYISAEKGETFEVYTYALDGNKLTYRLNDIEKVSENKETVNNTLLKFKVTGDKPEAILSFTGGESLGSSVQEIFAVPRSFGSSKSIYVSIEKYQYGYDASGQRVAQNKYGKFTTSTSGVYGGAVYCAEHGKTPTVGGITGTLISDTTIRKIMYYGYRGPAQWSGFASSSNNSAYKIWGSNTNKTEIAGTVITSQALSNRYRSLGGSGITTNPQGLSAFMSYVNSQPDPGNSYAVYRASASGQDLMFGVYQPKGYAKVQKSVASNKHLTDECKNMYSLKGAEYRVSKNKDGSGYLGSLTTDASGKTNTLKLTPGTYYVREAKAPKGFALDPTVHTVNVVSGQTATVQSKDEPLFDPIGIVLQKTATDNSYLNKSNMSDAEFEIAYYNEMLDKVEGKTPTRKWVLKTMKAQNGNYVSLLQDKYKVSGDAFYKSEKGSIVIPRGTVTIREIKAPKGYKVDSKVYVTHVDNDLNFKDQLVYNFGNTPKQPNKPLNPEIHTTASDRDTTDNIGSYGKNITLIDKVAYKELSENETYTVKGVLMDKATGKPLMVNGKRVTAEKTFTVTKDNSTIDGNGARGTVELEFNVDSTVLAGKTTVVFEHLYYDKKEIATHTDIEDEGQTVHFSEIKTTAKSAETGSMLGMPREKEILIDTVKYTNLIPGKEYTIKGVLMDKDTGKPIKDENGRKITAEKTFTPNTAEGSIDLEFTYNSLLRQGKTTVVFEDVYHNGIKVGTHADINDKGQSIEYPNIHTSADFKSLGRVNNGMVTILDKVSYKNLAPGKKYTVKGILMDKATGKPFIANGKEVKGETTFTPISSTGTITVEFTFPASAIEGKTVVVFENLYNDNIKIATHSDITDMNQTVEVGRMNVRYGGANGYPITGDENVIWIFASILLLSAGGLMLVVKRKNKKNKKDK